jgi:GPH family glycoside/pentoside/hexuronide:cation symporter
MNSENPITSEENGEKIRPFGWKDKLSYAAGDFGCNMSFALSGSTFALFYNQYLQIETWIFAIILVVLKVWDAINDPLIGAIVDHSKIKTSGRLQGKFKRFIFVGAIGLIFSSAITFLPIPNAELGVKIFVCILTYIVWDASYTLANVPYGAMAATITADPVQRARLSMWRNIGAFLAALPIAIILPIITFDEDNNLLGERLIWIALILGVIGFFAFIFLIRTTVERVTPHQIIEDVLESENSIKGKRKKINYIKDLKAFFTNRAALGVTFGSVSFFLGMFGAQTAITVMFQSYFENVRLSALILPLAYLPMFIVIPLIPNFVRKFGKKKVSEYGLLLGILGGLLMIFLPIPRNNTGIAVFLSCSMLSSLGLAFFSNISYAMVSDSIDYMEWKTGERNEGTIYAYHSFFRKVAQGVGPGLVLLLMAWLGYEETFGAVQTFQTDTNIRYLVAALNLFGLLMAWICVKFIYNIDKKTVLTMEAELGHNK